jgi:4'-phosphopantetheinyl transferase
VLTPAQAAGALDPPLALNVSHDGALVALAFAPVPAADAAHAPAYRLGVDVMRVALPRRETLRAFVGAFVDQLAPPERAELGLAAGAAGALPDHRVLGAFFRVWTLKEAYTKALGLGLGFDFARLALAPLAGPARTVLSADGAPAAGWALAAWASDVGDARYLGAVARFVGDRAGAPEVVDVPEAGWVERFAADEFVRRAIDVLGT